jgi:hypothetical protein
MTTNLFQGAFLAIPVWAVDVITKHGHPRDLQVLVGLVSLMERRKLEVTASVTQISDHVGVSRETVKRSLKWLGDYGIITVKKRQKPTVNVYTVHYTDAGLGSRVTHTRVTGDPPLGSRVTHPEGPTRVTGDPSNVHETFTTSGPNGLPIDIYIDIDIKDKERAASGRDVDMIFGSDEDYVDNEIAPPKKKKKHNINSLVSHFVNHRQSAMAKSYSAKDLTILRVTMKTLKESGLTDFTIMQMVSKFFSVTRWRESDNSVLLFAKKDIQKQLLSEIDSSVDTDDTVLQLMLNDFDRSDLDLPWEKKHDQVLKRAIIMRGTDICYRYPEIISSLVRQYPGDFNNENFVKTLTTLNSLVRVITGEESGEIGQVLQDLDGMVLPDDLKSGKTALLRPSASSLVEAVYNYRRKNHGS